MKKMLMLIAALCAVPMACKKIEERYLAEETGYNNHKFNFLLIYMTTDNDLSPYAVDVLNRLEKGAAGAWVYCDLADSAVTSAPFIMQITKDDSAEIVSPVVKSYPEQNSLDRNVMYRVLQDMKSLAWQSLPRDSRYLPVFHLVVWGHGSSFFPGEKEVTAPKTTASPLPKIGSRSLGWDEGFGGRSFMNLKDFKWVIGDLNFYSVIFDSCHMATAEVYEELKDCCRFFAASPTEMPAEGLRYEFLNPDGEYDFDAENYDYDLSLFGDLFRVSRDYYAQQPTPEKQSFCFLSIRTNEFSLTQDATVFRTALESRLQADPGFLKTLYDGLQPATAADTASGEKSLLFDMEGLYTALELPSPFTGENPVGFEMVSTGMILNKIPPPRGLGFYFPVVSETEINEMYRGLNVSRFGLLDYAAERTDF